MADNTPAPDALLPIISFEGFDEGNTEVSSAETLWS